MIILKNKIVLLGERRLKEAEGRGYPNNYHGGTDAHTHPSVIRQMRCNAHEARGLKVEGYLVTYRRIFFISSILIFGRSRSPFPFPGFSDVMYYSKRMICGFIFPSLRMTVRIDALRHVKYLNADKRRRSISVRRRDFHGRHGEG